MPSSYSPGPQGHLGQKEAGHAPLERMLAHPHDRGEADGIFHPQPLRGGMFVVQLQRDPPFLALEEW